MEPITTIIASAIAMGAAAGIKPTVAQAVKDAYAGLKRIIQDSYGGNGDVVDAVDYVSKKPEAEGRRAELVEALAKAGADGDGALAKAAKELIAIIDAEAPEVPSAIGVDIGRLKAAVLEFENVQAGDSGTGVRIEEADIAGTASFKNIGPK